MGIKTSKTDIALGAVVLLFFAGIFAHLTVPLFDNDFWWHLATGKWMWQHKAMIHADPFDFPSYPHDFPVYTKFFLKQYWLSQLLMYGVYSASGFAGLIVLRAAVMTLMFYALYRLLLRAGAGRAISVALVYVSATVIIQEFSYIGLRPQMWTSLFSLVLILLLEIEREGKRWARYAIPALMLLWANMHGGYILGVVIIAIYALSALVTRRRGKAFYITCAAAVSLTSLNPAGISAYIITWLVNMGSDASAPWNRIIESESILSHASLGGIARDLPYLAGIAMASVASFVVNIKGLRRYRLEYILLFALAAFMGVKAIRFIIFFVAIASLVTAYNLRPLVELLRGLSSRKALARVAAVVLTAALVLGLAGDQAVKGERFTGLRSGQPYEDDLGGAVRFIKKFGIRGNAFNEHGRGGYLIWWLWPDVKVFIDGRGLYLTAFEQYEQAMLEPLAQMPSGKLAYKEILDEYGVNIAVLSGCDKASGVLIQLSYALLNDDDWAVAYADRGSIVFMRRIPEYNDFLAKHELPRKIGYENILAMASTAMRSMHGHGVAGAKLSMAVGFMGVGEKRKAHFWINEYLKLVPNDGWALDMKYRILRMEDGAAQ